MQWPTSSLCTKHSLSKLKFYECLSLLSLCFCDLLACVKLVNMGNIGMKKL